MSSELTDVTDGLVKGTLFWGEEKIKEFARKFKNKQLVFIQDEETINLVKSQLKSGEWSLFCQYVSSKELRLLVQLGLTLRKLDADKNEKALLNLRTKILEKYRKKGLYIAQFVQSKILNEFISAVADKTNSVSELIEKVEGLLNNLDKYLIFVQKEDELGKIMKQINIKITANSPDFLIIFTCKSAMSLGFKVKEILEKDSLDYDLEIKEDKTRLLLFLFKKEQDLLLQT